MRNLILSQLHNELLSSITSSLKQTTILLSLFDEISQYLILIGNDMKIYIFSYHSHSHSKLLHQIELDTNLSSYSDLLLQIMTTIDTGSNPFIFITYKPEIESLIFSLSTGELITLSLNANSPSLIKLTKGQEKLIAMEASPNQEHIVCILSNFTLLLLSYDSLEKVNECALDDGDNSDSSKDKSCKEASISFKQSGDLFGVCYKINNGYKCLVRDMKLNIVKGPGRADKKIVFSVAEEPIEYLSNFISFQPNGSLIAFYDNRKKEIFFSEKNCLIHGRFQLSLNEYKDMEIKPLFLKWNFDSPMILFIYEINNIYYMQIYYRSNYEWSLKYESVHINRIINAKFSDVSSNQLLLLYNDSTFEVITLIWQYTSSIAYSNNYPNNKGEICVIDNISIKYSPLGIVNIPPPMSLVKIDKSKGKKFFWYRNFYFALFSKGVEVYKSESKDFKLFATLEFSNEIDVNKIKRGIFVPLYNKQIGYIIINAVKENELDNEYLYFISFNVEYTNDTYRTIEAIRSEKEITIKEKILCKCNCGNIFTSVKYDQGYDKEYYTEEERESLPKLNTDKKNDKKNKAKMDLDMLDLDHINQHQNKKDNNDYIDTNTIYFYFESNNIDNKENTITLYSYNSDTGELKEENAIQTNKTHNERIIKIQSGITSNSKEVIFYLTHNNKLYQNGKILSNDINSFILFKQFLLFTQVSSSPYSTLHLIDLNKQNINIFDPSLYVQNLNYKNFNMRTCERGCQLVTCSNINVVLQMIRGNIETIYPRLIVLHEIKKQVQKEEYDIAFSLCRKHKINLNFIYDINPQKFIIDIKKFILKVKQPQYINLFINSLSSVICDEYIILHNINKNKKQSENIDKINTICIMTKNILIEMNKKNESYINSILITYIKQSPPLYLEALKVVQKLKIENNDKADKALEFLCWVVNADILFNISLKTYDFELVIMCAKHTQKDPKEYLSYLNSLEEIKKNDIILMKYQINIDQKCYKDALYELSKGGSKYFDKCIELINKYDLFDYALTLFNQPVNEMLYIKIFDARGDFYSKSQNKQLYKAALCYMRSKSYSKALQCYLQIGKVNEALSLLISKIHLKEEEQQQQQTNLYTHIIELLDLCRVNRLSNEIEKIYTFIISGDNIKQFQPNEITNIIFKLIEASTNNKMFIFSYFSTINLIRIISQDNITIASNIMKEFNDKINFYVDININTLKKNHLYFDEKYSRLLKVQELKREHPELFIIDINKGDNEVDDISESGSVRSKSNKSSYSTLSRRTKMKNKNRTVKEGSPMEEENLIQIIKDLKLDDREIDSLEQLSEVLMMLKQNDKSEEIAKEKESYIKNVNSKINNIYSIEQINFANDNPIITEIFPELSIGSILNKPKDDPNVKEFKKQKK